MRWQEHIAEGTSHIAFRRGPSDRDEDIGCVVTLLIAIVVLTIVFFLSGCATGYATLLRHEYSTTGECYGVYRGEKEYPALFPATRTACSVEVVYWWGISDADEYDLYKLYLWPIGAVCSLADVPISLASDTIMFPYDYLKRRHRNARK